MLRTRTSRWTAGTVALCVLLLVGAWFLLVGPRQAQADELNAQRDQAEGTNSRLQLDIQRLKADSLNLPARQAEMARIRQQFPNAVQLPKLIRDLNTMSVEAGVTFDSLTPGVPSAFSVQPAATAAAPAAATEAAPAAATEAAPSVALLQVPVSLKVTGDYFQVAALVKRLQAMPRVILITQLQVAAAPEPKDAAAGIVNGTLMGQVYVLPDELPAVASGSPPGASPQGAPGAAGSPPGNLGGSGPSVTPQVQTTAPQNP